ncbi:MULTISPECIES: N-acyl-D-amino-acid deacylase family protein [Bradyrhizobium]|uniref:Bll1004 protein n=1 Tax=Bradyrhizobium diazoefficiens (strain JCM 10833 / BCRC 13528 / IAM 13628 / NBRC 14792 / USDA 110) TaxID=224911 RepID=Q89VP1_BRADU|nr:amidohydrolase family protein [Bradyrhizobium diazoefficiens]MBP1060308.1 N-acyl-D-aspartate/D-glutamate deacylase [Bradyrhizobium japonicum]AND86713.1 amidohydrolase [Bradyrhizobium diazoefficiens USDA 110]AWO88123.1 amidohydrolase family protein [Bradyrhizobium diazoefficiens]PDT62162.1 amidohydrolase [Bradyrhizobium diazoefficiens]QBP19943.1 D-aminoacylase [Bradyrhizobium diazoefficiens]
MTNPDLVIRGGMVADGNGGELFEADVAITGGRISEVGKISGKGKEEIDARGKLVTPGFVDVHTHYDGQVTWSQDITPSSQNGVTTAIMGNCGVGFAPCKPADHTRLIQLMEGVEDIPEPVLSAGIPWAWESFPDYMGWLSKRDFDIDVGAQLPHAALRVYVMGERGARRDPSTVEDNAAMAKLAGEAVRSGALGFSTSRTLNHRTSTGDFTPTLKAGEDELTAIAGAMHREGRSVLQFVLDLSTIDDDLPMMLRVADTTKCPISFSITQNDKAPQRWRQTLDEINAAAQRGLSITAQIAARPVGLLLGLELSRNPFQTHPSYRAIAHLPLKERLARLHQPEVRQAILSETATATDDPLFFRPNYDKMFLLGDPPDYEQPPENALGPQARKQGRKPEELAYDAMLSDEGRGMLYVPFLNYADGNLDATREMLIDPQSVPGLSDGGAHCGIICDASFPTYLLTHWTRDRTRGEKLSIPFVVAAQSRKTALSVGLTDRGLIAPGYKADINVIDYDRLHLHPPKVHYDLPVGGRRLLQDVDGYEATIVSGVVTRRHGAATGRRPGKLIRGAQGVVN